MSQSPSQLERWILQAMTALVEGGLDSLQDRARDSGIRAMDGLRRVLFVLFVLQGVSAIWIGLGLYVFRSLMEFGSQELSSTLGSLWTEPHFRWAILSWLGLTLLVGLGFSRWLWLKLCGLDTRSNRSRSVRAHGLSEQEVDARIQAKIQVEIEQRIAERIDKILTSREKPSIKQ